MKRHTQQRQLHTRLRRASSVLLLLAIGTTSTSCDGKAPPGKVVTVRLGTFSKAIGNAPYHIAKEQGLFPTRVGSDSVIYDFVEYTDRATIGQEFSAGTLNILFSGDAPAILSRAQGNDIRLVGLSSNTVQEIIAKTGSGLRSVRDLRGKQVAVQSSTTSHYALLRILAASGMGERDVKLVFSPAPDARTAFDRGQYDAWAVWSPFAEEQVARGKGTVIERSQIPINSVISMHRGFLEAHEAVAQGILDAIAAAQDTIASNPALSMASISRQLGFDTTAVRLSWPKFNWKPQVDSAIVVDLQSKAAFLAEQDLTRQSRVVDVKSELLWRPVR